MPRQRRQAYPNLFYHIFNRGLQKQNIFLDHNDYKKFMELLLRYKKQFDWKVYCYSVMPNHYHLLCQTKKDPLGKIISSLQTAYAVYFNKKNERLGPVFNNRFKSIIIQYELYFKIVSKYIHNNSKKAGLVKNLIDYPYSSYPEYIIGKNSVLDENIIDKRLIRRIVGIEKNAINNYHRFVEEEPMFKYEPVNNIFGNLSFTTKISKKLNKKD